MDDDPLDLTRGNRRSGPIAVTGNRHRPFGVETRYPAFLPKASRAAARPPIEVTIFPVRRWQLIEGEAFVVQSLDQKYEIIRGREERFAFELAKQVIEKPKASVWLIFLPILFVFYAQRLQKYKSSIHSFAKGFMVTKIIALDAALEEAKTGRFSSETIAARFPNSDSEEKKAVRQKQFEEIDILRPHYLLLLKAAGSSYQELLKGAYVTSGAYRALLNELFKAEEEVNNVVLQDLQPTAEAREVVERMEKLSERLREMEIEEIFA
jgi:hypothetical protein